MKYQYIPEENEFLDQQSYDPSLEIIQRNSITRIKQVEINGSVFYHSSNQNRQEQRMIIFIFLSTIFKQFSINNMKKWQKFKKMIYKNERQYKNCVKSIQPKELLKYFSAKFSQILINTEAQKNIVLLLNNYSLIQSILFLAIQKQLQNLKQNINITINQYQNWLQKQYNFELIIIEQIQHFQEYIQNETALYLYKINGHLMKKSYTIQRISSDSSQKKQIIIIEQTKKHNQYTSIRMDDTTKKSPILSSQKQKKNKNSKSKQKKQISMFQVQQKKIQNKPSGFFSRLWCCGQ